MTVDEGSPVREGRGRRRSNRRVVVAGAVIAAALAFVLLRGLDESTMYFRTADEAVAQRETLEGERFRIEGTVVPGTIRQDGPFTLFAIASKGTTVEVRNSGQPLGIFQENIPVVLEGRFATGSNRFESDRIMVRHSSDYEAKYPERISGEANL